MSRIRNFFHAVLFALAMTGVLFAVMLEWALGHFGKLRQRLRRGRR